MAFKTIVVGKKSKNDFCLRLKGRKTFHRVPADNLSQAKFKFLRGMKNVNERDIIVKGKCK